jgi:hypothetical protein
MSALVTGSLSNTTPKISQAINAVAAPAMSTIGRRTPAT